MFGVGDGEEENFGEYLVLPGARALIFVSTSIEAVGVAAVLSNAIVSCADVK